jgi:hypothetical protein
VNEPTKRRKEMNWFKLILPILGGIMGAAGVGAGAAGAGGAASGASGAAGAAATEAATAAAVPTVATVAPEMASMPSGMTVADMPSPPPGTMGQGVAGQLPSTLEKFGMGAYGGMRAQSMADKFRNKQISLEDLYNLYTGREFSDFRNRTNDSSLNRR